MNAQVDMPQSLEEYTGSAKGDLWVLSSVDLFLKLKEVHRERQGGSLFDMPQTLEEVHQEGQAGYPSIFLIWYALEA